MDRNDQQAISGLFGRLADVERQAPQRDAEADTFIRERIASQPGAPYYMAQTIVVQEQALEAAQARIEELEAQAARPQSGGGLFGSLFGGGQQQPARRTVPSIGSRPGGAYPGALGAAPAAGQVGQIPQRAGGGFLAGAAQTAMGVAGGMLLANAIGGLLAPDTAQAAEPEPQAEETGADDGGDFGDMEF